MRDEKREARGVSFYSLLLPFSLLPPSALLPSGKEQEKVFSMILCLSVSQVAKRSSSRTTAN